MLHRLPSSPAPACNNLPGQVHAQRLDGLEASLGNLLAGETEGRDNVIEAALYEAAHKQSVVEYHWPGQLLPAPRFPMPHTDVSMVSASFAVPLAELRALLPDSPRLTVARITPWHGLLTVFAFHHHRSGLGRYQELGIGTPMLLDKPSVPFWPLAFESTWAGSQPAMGLFMLEMPCDRPRPAQAGQRLYGLPRLLAHAEFALGSQTGLASMDADGLQLASLEVSAPRSFLHRRLDLSFTMFSLLEGRVIRTRNAMITDGYRGARGTAKVEFGDHPRFARLRALRLMNRPLETRVCSHLNMLVGGPEDLGPA